MHFPEGTSTVLNHQPLTISHITLTILSLPSIKVTVDAALREVERRLSALPELPRNVEHEVRTCLSEFYREIKAAVKEAVSLYKLPNQFMPLVLTTIRNLCRNGRS